VTRVGPSGGCARHESGGHVGVMRWPGHDRRLLWPGYGRAAQHNRATRWHYCLGVLYKKQEACKRSERCAL
jgi:hypothetical protein